MLPPFIIQQFGDSGELVKNKYKTHSRCRHLGAVAGKTTVATSSLVVHPETLLEFQYKATQWKRNTTRKMLLLHCKLSWLHRCAVWTNIFCVWTSAMTVEEVAELLFWRELLPTRLKKNNTLMFVCRLAKQHCMRWQLMRRKSGFFFALCLWPPAEMLGFNFPLDLVL